MTKSAAQQRVRRAIKMGLLVRPATCERCGHLPHWNATIQAHHPDYERPLDVMWLCGSCHRSLHPGTKLSKVRMTIVQLIAKGLSNREIASRLAIKPRTVANVRYVCKEQAA